MTSMGSPQPFPPLRVRRESFDPIVIAVHWITAAAVGAMFGLAFSIDSAPDVATQGLLLTLHRSLGMLIWMLTAFRLLWRSTKAKLPPWPGSMSKPQRWLARLNEYGLYGLLLIQPVTGVLQSLYHGKAFELWTLTVPPILHRDEAKVNLFENLHSVGAWALGRLPDSWVSTRPRPFFTSSCAATAFSRVWPPSFPGASGVARRGGRSPSWE